jgi:hypothetical protein
MMGGQDARDPDYFVTACNSGIKKGLPADERIIRPRALLFYIYSVPRGAWNESTSKSAPLKIGREKVR